MKKLQVDRIYVVLILIQFLIGQEIQTPDRPKFWG